MAVVLVGNLFGNITGSRSNLTTYSSVSIDGNYKRKKIEVLTNSKVVLNLADSRYSKRSSRYQWSFLGCNPATKTYRANDHSKIEISYARRASRCIVQAKDDNKILVEWQIAVYNGGRFDIGIDKIWLEPEVCEVGKRVRLYTRIKNYAKGYGGDVEITYFIDNKTYDDDRATVYDNYDTAKEYTYYTPKSREFSVRVKAYLKGVGYTQKSRTFTCKAEGGVLFTIRNVQGGRDITQFDGKWRIIVYDKKYNVLQAKVFNTYSNNFIGGIPAGEHIYEVYYIRPDNQVEYWGKKEVVVRAGEHKQEVFERANPYIFGSAQVYQSNRKLNAQELRGGQKVAVRLEVKPNRLRYGNMELRFWLEEGKVYRSKRFNLPNSSSFFVTVEGVEVPAKAGVYPYYYQLGYYRSDGKWVLVDAGMSGSSQHWRVLRGSGSLKVEVRSQKSGVWSGELIDKEGKVLNIAFRGNQAELRDIVTGSYRFRLYFMNRLNVYKEFWGEWSIEIKGGERNFFSFSKQTPSVTQSGFQDDVNNLSVQGVLRVLLQTNKSAQKVEIGYGDGEWFALSPQESKTKFEGTILLPKLTGSYYLYYKVYTRFQGKDIISEYGRIERALRVFLSNSNPTLPSSYRLSVQQDNRCWNISLSPVEDREHNRVYYKVAILDGDDKVVEKVTDKTRLYICANKKLERYTVRLQVKDDVHSNWSEWKEFKFGEAPINIQLSWSGWERGYWATNELVKLRCKVYGIDDKIAKEGAIFRILDEDMVFDDEIFKSRVSLRKEGNSYVGEVSWVVHKAAEDIVGDVEYYFSVEVGGKRVKSRVIPIRYKPAVFVNYIEHTQRLVVGLYDFASNELLEGKSIIVVVDGKEYRVTTDHTVSWSDYIFKSGHTALPGYAVLDRIRLQTPKIVVKNDPNDSSLADFEERIELGPKMRFTHSDDFEVLIDKEIIHIKNLRFENNDVKFEAVMEDGGCVDEKSLERLKVVLSNLGQYRFEGGESIHFYLSNIAQIHAILKQKKNIAIMGTVTGMVASMSSKVGERLLSATTSKASSFLSRYFSSIDKIASKLPIDRVDRVYASINSSVYRLLQRRVSHLEEILQWLSRAQSVGVSLNDLSATFLIDIPNEEQRVLLLEKLLWDLYFDRSRNYYAQVAMLDGMNRLAQSGVPIPIELIEDYLGARYAQIKQDQRIERIWEDIKDIEEATFTDAERFKIFVSNALPFVSSIQAIFGQKPLQEYIYSLDRIVAVKSNIDALLSDDTLRYSGTIEALTICDLNPPKLSIAPVSAEVHSSLLHLEGSVEDDEAIAKVFVNGYEARLIGSDPKVKKWRYNLMLKEGRNVIKIVVIDSSGNKTDRTLVVTYKKPKSDLIIASSFPNKNQKIEIGDGIEFRLTIANQGDARSGSTSVEYYISLDASIDGRDRRVGSDVIAPLDPKKRFKTAEYITFDRKGDYWLYACILPDSKERDKTNNCSLPIKVEVQKGVVDSDGDGVADENDAFVNDPAASIDSDGDGCPDRWNEGKSEKDSTTGLKLDEYPNDPNRCESQERAKCMEAGGEWIDGVCLQRQDEANESSCDRVVTLAYDPKTGEEKEFPTPCDVPDGWIEGKAPDRDRDGVNDIKDAFVDDPKEWRDSDKDGVGDNADRFPNDPAASIDSDGDGCPDRWNEGKSKKDSTTGLKLDEYPNDPNRCESQERAKCMEAGGEWIDGSCLVEENRDYVRSLYSHLVSRKEFTIQGYFYSYDFNGDGVVQSNDWVFVTRGGDAYRLLGKKPSDMNAFGFEFIDKPANLAKEPSGYFVKIDFKEDDERFSWVYITRSGKVYKLMGATRENTFYYLDIDGDGVSDALDVRTEFDGRAPSKVIFIKDTLPGLR